MKLEAFLSLCWPPGAWHTPKKVRNKEWNSFIYFLSMSCCYSFDWLWFVYTRGFICQFHLLSGYLFLSPFLHLISSYTVSFFHFVLEQRTTKVCVHWDMCFYFFLFFVVALVCFLFVVWAFFLFYARSKEEGGKHTSHPGESLNNPLQSQQGSTGEEAQAAQVSTTLERNSLPKGVQQHNRATAGE